MATKPKKKKPTAKKSSRRPARRAARKAAPKHKPRKKPESLRLTDVTVSITVNDLIRSRAWYCDLLGFVVADEWKHEGRIVGYRLLAGRSSIMLGQDDFAKGRDRQKGVGSRFYFITKQDVDALAARIKAGGQKLDSEPADQDWGAREFGVTDPDGFKITLGKW
jgi:uncharacterized glyoxalase superfamily protein PhnB